MYICSFHWIFLDIDMKTSTVYIFDSRRYPEKDYEDMIHMLKK